jgi:exonuclease III
MIVQPNSNPRSNTTKLSIFTININGFNNPRKQSELKLLQKEYKWQILNIVDTRMTSSPQLQFLITKILKPTFATYSLGTRHTGGLLSLFYIPVTGLTSSVDSSNRILQSKFNYHGKSFTLQLVYAPPSPTEKAMWYDISFPSFLENNPLQGQYQIITGDFNTVDNLTLDTFIPNHRHHHHCYTRSLMETNHLVDTFRHCHPLTREYTNVPPRGNPARLDRTYLNLQATSNIISAEHVHPSSSLTDHFSGIELSLSLPVENPKGPGFWMLNTSYLKRPSYIALIKVILDKYKDNLHTFPNPSLWWESLKIDIKNQSIPYSRTESTRVRQTKKTLRKNIRHLTHKTLPLPPLHPTRQLLRQKQISLQKYINSETTFYKQHSHTLHVLQGEQPSKHFRAKAFPPRDKQLITALKNPSAQSETIYTQQQDIHNIVTKYYSNLFQTPEITKEAINPFLSSTPRPTTEINPITITLATLLQATSSLPKNKTPGIDGLPVEFYSTFWNEIGPLLLVFLTHALTQTTLPPSTRHGVIILIHKKNSTQDIKNYRPITLLCTDYKILAKSVSLHLQHPMKSLISPYQSGFVPGRNIQDILHYTLNKCPPPNNHSASQLLLLADFNKAFDSLSRDFLFSTLSHLNFSPQIIHIIQLLHSHSTATININGNLTSTIPINSGVRQGCPLAPYLFILAIDTFLHHIQTTPLKGFSTVLPSSSFTTKALAFADDITFFLDSPHELPQLLTSINTLAEVSNLHLNHQKSTIVHLTSNPEHPDSIQNIPVLQISQTTKLLGITIGPTFTEKHTWDNILLQLKSSIRAWSSIQATLYGRIRIAQAYLQAKITYYAKILPISPPYLRQLDALLNTFVQLNRPSHLAKYRPFGAHLLQNTHNYGGLNYHPPSIHIKALQIQTISQVFLPPYAPWKLDTIATLHKDVPIGSHILLSHKSILNHITNRKWRQFLSTYLHQNISHPTITSPLHILRQPLLFNPHILDTPLLPFRTKPQLTLCKLHNLLFISDIVQFHDGTIRIRPSPIPSPLHTTKFLNLYRKIVLAIPSQWKDALQDFNLNPSTSPWWQHIHHPHLCYQLITTSPPTTVHMRPYTLNSTTYELTPHSTSHTYHSLAPFIPIFPLESSGSLYLQPLHFNNGNHVDKTKFLPCNTHLPDQTLTLLKHQLNPTNHPHSQLEFWKSHWPFIPLQLPSVLKNLHQLFLDPKIKELTFKIITLALPLGVRPWTGPSIRPCPSCSTNAQESETHIFFECPYTEKLRLATLDLMNKKIIEGSERPHPPLRRLHLSPLAYFTGALSHGNKPTQNFLHMAICLFFRVVWQARCKATFENQIPTITSSKKSFFHQLNKTISTYLHHLHNTNRTSYTTLTTTLARYGFATHQENMRMFKSTI